MSSTAAVFPPPTVKVGGKEYQIRYGNGAFYLLSTWGIDATSISKTLNEMFRDGRYTEAMYKLAAAGLGTTRNGKWITANLSPLELADALEEDEAATLMNTVWEQFSGKLGLATKKTTATQPADTPDSQSATGSASGVSE